MTTQTKKQPYAELTTFPEPEQWYLLEALSRSFRTGESALELLDAIDPDTQMSDKAADFLFLHVGTDSDKFAFLSIALTLLADS